MTLSDSEAADAAPADDLRAAIDAAFDAPEPEAAAPETNSEGPARDEQGRFAPKKAEEAAPAEAAPEAAQTTDQPAKAADSEPAEPAIAPPASWSAAEKELWATLPRAAQDAILRRESDVSKGFQQRAEEAKAWEPLRAALAPHADRLQRLGRHPAQVIAELLDAHAQYEANPQAALQRLAAQAGLSFNPAPATQPAGVDQWVDPQVAEAQRAAQAALQRVEQFERQQQQMQQAAVFQSAEREIEAIAKDTAKYPHFEAVREEMGRLIGAGVASDLADAYERAIWTVPEIRQRIQEDQRKAEREREAKAAEEARRKAVSLRNNPSGAALTAPASVSLRDELERAFGG